MASDSSIRKIVRTEPPTRASYGLEGACTSAAPSARGTNPAYAGHGEARSGENARNTEASRAEQAESIGRDPPRRDRRDDATASDAWFDASRGPRGGSTKRTSRFAANGTTYIERSTSMARLSMFFSGATEGSRLRKRSSARPSHRTPLGGHAK